MKNKFLSLAWFKEKLHLKSSEEKLQKRVDEEVAKIFKTQSLYRTIRLVNSSLTIVLYDGTVLNKPDATTDDYNYCIAAKTVEEIRHIISDTKNVKSVPKVEEEPVIVTAKEVETIKKGYEALRDLSDFKIEDGCVYWGDIKRSLPQQLVEAICKLVESEGAGGLYTNEQYLSLKKFWLKCCLNPNAQSAEDLYTFLSNHKFKIDRHGNFYAYRRVKSKHTNQVDKELMEFVSNAYTKVKAVWKYNPKHFTVHNKDNEYRIQDTRKKNYESHKDGLIGNLATMYLDITNTPGLHYTSAHTGLEDYRIGEVISMPRNQGDDNNNVSCSTGFHAASKKYDYSGFGDCPILMIINPTDVLSVPKGEVGKLRTCRWFFACVLDEKEKHILDEDCFDVTNLGDLFEEKIQENIEDDIVRGFAEEVERHSFYVPTVTDADIKYIVKSLDEMKKTINSRVEKI
jgi:hypothetical protein